MCLVKGVRLSELAKISISDFNPKENLISEHLYSMVFNYVYQDETAPAKANQFGVAFMQHGENMSNIDRNIILYRNKSLGF